MQVLALQVLALQTIASLYHVLMQSSRAKSFHSRSLPKPSIVSLDAGKGVRKEVLHWASARAPESFSSQASSVVNARGHG